MKRSIYRSRLRHRIYWPLLCLCALLAIACHADQQENSVMFIQPPVKTFVISSPLQGRLVKNGEPLANAQLIRTLEWNGDQEGSKQEVFTTDAQGYFEFPLFELEMAMRGLEQFVAKTKIYINSVSEDNLLWYSPKMYEEIYGETGGPLQNFVCDINNAQVVTQDTPENILTRCRWTNMSDFVEI